MIYRKFRASTYREAVLKAKMEMGNDVYIIGRKEIKEGGVLGLFTKKLTEITVAKSEEKRLESTESQTEPKKKNVDRAEKVSQETLLRELDMIKKKLDKLANQKEVEPTPRSLDQYVKIFRENDFSEDYIERMIRHFESEITLKDSLDSRLVVEKLKRYLRESIITSGPIKPGKARPTVVVLVGPTGVGKTTTVAKLAATYGVIQKHSVELFTIDSYRIAAVEQLGKYAELMQIPLTLINTRDEFKKAIEHSSSELIFVDTAGKSQKNNLAIAELRNILDGYKGSLDIHLVLSATTKYNDAIDIVTRFNHLMYEHIILSKLDETNTIGQIISVLGNSTTLSYFTTGQSVPDDIELANKEKLINMINLTEGEIETEEARAV